MRQNPLFHDDVFGAMRADISAIGGTKIVGNMLWPEKSVTEASNLLNNCLNSARPEKLDHEQVILIKKEAKKVGSFETQNFEADEIGMTRPMPIEPEDEIAALQRQFIQAQKDMKKMLDRMESVAASKLKAAS